MVYMCTGPPAGKRPRTTCGQNFVIFTYKSYLNTYRQIHFLSSNFTKIRLRKELYPRPCSQCSPRPIFGWGGRQAIPVFGVPISALLQRRLAPPRLGVVACAGPTRWQIWHWRYVQDRAQWKHLVETATFQSGTRMSWRWCSTDK